MPVHVGRAIAGAAIALAAAASLQAATVTNYVALHEGGTYDGQSWGTAFTNIQDALDAAPSNNLICLAGHTFRVTNALVLTNSSIELRGGYAATNAADQPGARDVWRWPTAIAPVSGVSTRLAAVSNATAVTLNGLQFRGGLHTASGGALYAQNVTDLLLEDCLFVGNRAQSSANGFGGAIYALNCSGTVTNCGFSGNYATSTTGHLTGSQGGALFVSGGMWAIVDCLFRGNFTARGGGATRNYVSAGAIWTQSATQEVRNVLMAQNDGGGLHVNSGSAVVRNVTCFGNDPFGVSVAAAAAAGSAIRNSILYGNRDDFTGSLPTLEHNCIGDGTAAGTGGNFAGDPRFEFPLLYVATNSPCLDAGTGTVAEAGVAGTVLTNGASDSGTVDLGYHFADGVVFDSELYVSPSAGSDSNGGTGWGDALKSITRALQLAAPRTRIYLAAGSYTNGAETFPLVIQDRTIQLLGAGTTSTVINANGANKGAIQVVDCLFGANAIRDLTVTKGYNLTGSHGGGLHLNRSTLALENCLFKENRTTFNPCYGGGVYAQDSSALITNTVFDANLAAHSAGHLDGYGGGLFGHSGTLRMYSLVFATNVAKQSDATLSVLEGGGMRLLRGFFTLKNAVFAANVGGGLYAQDTFVEVENVTACANNEFGIRAGSAQASVKNSILWGNAVSDVTGSVGVAYSCVGIGIGHTDGGGNTNVNPQFADAQYLHLKSEQAVYTGGYFSGGTWSGADAYSPLLDKGDPASGYSQEPYYNGKRINMGAYGNTPVASSSRPPPRGIFFMLQ